MIKTIIFDLGGVYFTSGSGRAAEKIGKKYSVPVKKILDILKGSLGTDYRTDRISACVFWKKAKKRLGIKEDNRVLSEIWFDCFTPIKGTVEIVGKLKKKGYRVLFLSDNVRERVDYLESGYSFIKKFDGGVFSHIAKVRKPTLKIYRLVLEKASGPAENCVFIDDNPALLKPAQKLGMKTIKFENPGQLKAELKKIKVCI